MRTNTVLCAAFACAALGGDAAIVAGADFSASLVVMRTHNLAKLTQYHAIQFTTATTGVIKTVTIQYQGSASSFPNINGSRLIEVAGLGPGSYDLGPVETLATYTITNAVNVLGGTKVLIMLGDVLAREGCYGLIVKTLDANGTEIDSGLLPINRICNAAVADQIPPSPFKFGTCLIDPPRINDNGDLHFHMSGAAGNNPDGSKNSSVFCKLEGLSANGRVIAFPPAELDTRLVPKGATVHCTTSPCHLDVKIRNTAPPNGGIDGAARTWTWIGFNASP